MSTNNIEIRGGRVVDPASQFDDTASVFIADGKIARIAAAAELRIKVGTLDQT